MFGIQPSISVRRLQIVLMIVAALCGCKDRPGSTLRRPNLVSFDQQGHLLVSDFLNSRIIKFDTSGRCLGAIGERGLGRNQLWRVRGMVSLGGGDLAVINHSRTFPKGDDQEISYRRELKIFSPDGEERLAFPVQPPGEDQPGWPEQIEVVPEGIIIADTEREELLIFTPQGEFVRSLAELDDAVPLVTPSSPCWHDGRLWVTEYKAHRIRCLTLDGKELLRFGREGSGPGEFLFPETLAVSPEGWLAVTDLGNYRVQRFDLHGNYLNSIVPEPVSPKVKVQLSDVAVGPDNLLYLVDSKGNRVLVYKADGGLERIIDRWS